MAITKDELDVGNYVKKEVLASTADENGKIPFYKSWPSAATKGFIEGSLSLLGMAYEPEEGQDPQEYIKEYQNLRSNLRQKAETALPTNEGLPEELLYRGGKILPGMAAFGGPIKEILAQTAGGAMGGQVAKEMGGGPLSQAIGEVVGMNALNVANWAIRGRYEGVTPEQNRLAEFGRQQGLTEQDLVLTTNNRGVARDFAEEVATKGGKTVSIFEKTKENLGRVWNSMRERPEAKTALSGEASGKMVNEISKKLSKLPEKQRELIRQDYNDLLSTKMTGEDVIDFWQKLNYHITKGERSLGLLKEDLTKGLESISPEFSRDFTLTNQLYGNFAKQAERMGPDIADKLLNLGESGMLLNAIVTGNMPALQKALGLVGGRLLAREMVVNQRLQNLGSRMISAMNQGSRPAAVQTFNQMIEEIGKTNAEAARVLAQFDIEEYSKNLVPEKKKENSKNR